MVACFRAHSFVTQFFWASVCESRMDRVRKNSKFYIVFVSRRPSTAWNSSLVVMTHGCAIACALNQTFAQCKIFLEGTLRATLSRNTANRSGVGAVGASTHQKVWFVENPGKISENSGKTTSNETEWWNTSKNEYWRPTRQIEDRFFWRTRQQFWNFVWYRRDSCLLCSVD